MYKLRIVRAAESEKNIKFWDPNFTKTPEMDSFPFEENYQTIKEIQNAIEANGFLLAPSVKSFLRMENDTSHLVVHKHIKNDQGKMIPEGYLISVYGMENNPKEDSVNGTK